MKIGIANDHAGVAFKKELTKYISDKYGYEIVNFGSDSTESCNYPEFGEKCANAVSKGEVDKGIVICGTGIGISISANKVNGIRCANCSDPNVAKLSRQHNDSNMLAMGARIIDIEQAKKIVDAWITAEFEGGRHQTRVDLIKDIEKRQQK